MSEKSDSNDSHYDSAKAWRAQAGATVGLFFSIPSILTFGVFLNALLDAHRDHLSRHELTRIRGLAIALAFLLSPLYGLLASVMGPHRLFALAALGVQVGLYATSVAGSTALLTVAAIVQGIGCGGLFLASLNLSARWFRKHFRLASALGLSAVGLGMALLPTWRRIALQHFGWRLAMQSEAVGGAVILGAAFVFLVRDAPNATSSRASSQSLLRTATTGAFDWSLFRVPSFYPAMLQIYSAAAGAIVLLAIPPYMSNAHPHVDSSALLSTFGAASILARITLSAVQSFKLGEVLGNRLPVGAGCFVAVLSVCLLASGRETPTFALFFAAATLGLADAWTMVLQPALLAELFGPARFRSALSFWALSLGVAHLVTTEMAARAIRYGDAWRNALWVGAGVYAFALGALLVLACMEWKRCARRTDSE